MNEKKSKLKNKVQGILRENIMLAQKEGVKFNEEEIRQRLQEVKKWLKVK